MSHIHYTQSSLLKRLPVILLLIGLLAATACDTDDTSLERIQSAGTLRVGLDPTYPPFEVADGSNVTGFDVDLAAELSAALGVDPSFSYFGYDGLYDALLTDQVDVLISALVVSPERTRDFAYSRPYYDAGQVLIVPADSPISDPGNLAGRRVAVELGALGHVEALAMSRAQPNLSVLPYGSAAEALDAVSAGQADATLIDSIGGRLFLKDRPPEASPLRLLPDPVVSEPFAVVVRIEDEALLQQINSELAQLEDTGRLEQLITYWVGP